LIAATNRPDILDEALLRPGRFDRIIEIPLPNLEGRTAILSLHMGNMPTGKGVEVSKIAEQTEGFSGAELKALVVEAGMCGIRSGKKSVGPKEFKTALSTIKEKRINGGSKAPKDLWQ